MTMKVKEAERGSAPMNGSAIATILSADDWSDDKWVEHPVRLAVASGLLDAGVPERAECADDWMDDKWIEERVQGAEAPGSSSFMNKSQCDHIRRNTVSSQHSALMSSSTILTQRGDRQHEALRPVRQFDLRGRWGLSRGWRPIASYAGNL
jgi:hypothetical protein